MLISILFVVVNKGVTIKVNSPKVQKAASTTGPLAIWVAIPGKVFPPTSVSISSYNPITGASTGNSISLGTLDTMRSIGFSSDGQYAVATGDNSGGGIVIDIANLATKSDVELSDPNYTDNTTMVTSDVVITPNDKWAYVGLNAPNEIDLYIINLSGGTYSYSTPSFTNSEGINSLALCPGGNTLLGAPDGFIATGASTGNLTFNQIPGTPTAVECSGLPTAMFTSGSLATVSSNGSTTSTGISVPGSQILETAINGGSTLSLATGQNVNQVASGRYSLIGTVPSNTSPIGAASGDGFAILSNNGYVYYNGSSFSVGSNALALGFGITPPPQGLTVKQMSGDAFNAAMFCGGCFTQAIQGISQKIGAALSSQTAEIEAETGEAEATEVLPVNTANGNFTYQLPSISLVGIGPSVTFSPIYNSNSVASFGPVGLGPGFSDGALMTAALNTPAASDVTINQENGSQVTFYPQQSGGGCASPLTAIDQGSSLDLGGTYYCAYSGVSATLYSQSLSSPNSGTTDTFIRFSPYEVSTFCVSTTCTDQGNSYTQGELISLGDKFKNTDIINQDSTTGTGCSAAGYHCVTITDPSGRTLTYVVCATSSCTIENPAGEVTSVTDSVHTESFTYATATSSCATSAPATCIVGDLIGASFNSTSDSTVRNWTFSYDETSSLNAINSVIDPNGNTQLTNTYDDATTSDPYFGWVTAQTNALGNQTQFSYRIDPNGNSYYFSYDSIGRLTSFQDPVNGQTDFKYSTSVTPSFFSPTEIDLPNPGSDSLGYSSILVTYDANFGEITSIEQDGNYGGGTTNPTPTTTYSWCTSSTCPGGYLLGELESSTNPIGGTTTYGYDSSGDLTSITDPDNNTASATYDSIGRVLTTTSPNGNVPGCLCSSDYTTTYASATNPYTAFDQPTVIVGPPIGSVSATTTYTYDADGNTLSTTSFTGTSSYGSSNTTTPSVTKSYAYNAANQLCFSTTSVIATRNCASIPNNPLTITYAYNADGNLCYESVAAVSNPSCSTIPSGETTSWTYDAKGEVVSQTEPFGTLNGSTNSSNTTDYAYDLNGNLLSATLSTGLSNIYAYNSNNEVTGQTVGEIGTSTDITSSSCGGYIPFYGVYATYCYGVATEPNGTQALVANTTGSFIYANLPSTIASVSSVSCASISVCFATAIGTTGGISLVETTDSGTTWSIVTSLPFDANSNTQISCTSTTSCYITGPVSAITDLYSVTYSGSAWSLTSDGAVGQTVSSLNCPSSTVCYMAGTSSSTGYITGYNSGTFTSPTSFSSTVLNSISCANTTQCVAVGQGSSSAAIITTTTGTSWSTNSVTIPSSYQSLSSVSCPLSSSLTDCYTVGVSTTSTSVIGHITYSSPNFSITDKTSSIPYGTKSLNTVGCGYSTSCMALGSTDYSSAQVLYSTNSGSTWPMLFDLNTYSYDLGGKLSSTTDQLGQSTYSYDALGRLITATDDLGHITTYSYDNNSNVTCVGYNMASTTSGCSGTPSSTNQIVNYQYDTANRMTSLTTPMAPASSSCGTTSIGSDTLSFSYDANGSLISTQLPLCDNSSTNTLDSLTNTVDANYSLTGLTLNYPSGPTSKSESRNAASMLTTNWAGINTAYNSVGQLSYSSTTALTTTTPATYTYDNQGNPLVSPNASYSQCFSSGGEILSQYSLTSPPSSCTSSSVAPVNTYNYDSQGNRTSYYFPWNGQQTPAYYYYSPLGQLTGFSVFFTDWNYSYSSSGQLMQITSGSSDLATFTYNQLSSKILSDNTWDYVYGPYGKPVEAFKPNTALSEQYFITTDNNTVDAAVDTSNAISYANNYETFGNATPSSSQPQLGYDGAYNDPGTHFWIMGNRFYDPNTDLFLNPDPAISLVNQPYGYGGLIPSIGDPSQYYIFAGNDPANNYDPTGTGCIVSQIKDLIKSAEDIAQNLLERIVGGIARDTGEDVVGGGDHIVLGYASYGLEDTAARVGGRTLLDDPEWRSTLMQGIANPTTKFTVVLDGMPGNDTYAQIMSAAQRGATGIFGGSTDWEMAQLFENGRLPGAIFARGGNVVENPFVP